MLLVCTPPGGNTVSHPLVFSTASTASSCCTCRLARKSYLHFCRCSTFYHPLALTSSASSSLSLHLQAGLEEQLRELAGQLGEARARADEARREGSGATGAARAALESARNRAAQLEMELLMRDSELARTAAVVGGGLRGRGGGRGVKTPTDRVCGCTCM